MRCSYCGFENADDAKVCIKCKAPLDKARPLPNNPPVRSEVFGKTVAEEMAAPLEIKKVVYGKTISDESAAGEAGDRNDIEKDILIPCPKCGYLNPGDAVICANCKASLAQEEITVPENEDVADINSTTDTTIPVTPKKVFNATIDPYKKKSRPAECSFTPVPRDSEQNENTADTAKHFVYESEPVRLNRSNLDTGNYTITSKVQAEIFYKDNKWFILDKSDLETTFIRVSSAMELKEGDVVLMGDRKFIFSPGTNHEEADE